MKVVTRALRLIRFKVGSIIGISQVVASLDEIAEIIAEDHIHKAMHETDRYQRPEILNRFEYQVYSEHGEDGIIAEIFKRIGAKTRVFVEFGVGDGLQNNTAHLLLKNWTGYWIEGNGKYVRRIKQAYSALISEKKLSLKHAFITAENVETMFREVEIPEEFDLLSIDIDGNDYWIWKAINSFRPRVVLIEYNALFRPDTKWVMKYNAKHRWSGTCYFGASLKSLEILASEKGYRLVGCDYTGTNSFFVRDDLVEGKFVEPFTAENYYEPPRYYLRRKIGHKRDFGDFENI